MVLIVPKYCINCGKEALEGSSFCTECGIKDIPTNKIDREHTIKQKQEKEEKKVSNLPKDIENDLKLVVLFSSVFTFFTLGLQIFNFFGGFITVFFNDSNYGFDTTYNFYWNRISYEVFGFNISGSFNDFKRSFPDLELDIIWNSLKTVGLIWSLSIIIAIIFIMTATFNIYKYEGKKIRFNLPKIGVIIVLITNILEYSMFIILCFGENWPTDFTAQINLIYLFFFIIGNILLVLAYKRISRYSHLYLKTD